MHARLLGTLAAAAGLLVTVLPGAASAASCPSGVPTSWCEAVSHPVRDSVYPAPSHPAVDALHYRLRLNWQPARHRLLGDETLTFRAAHRVPMVRLALAHRVHVRFVRLDGRPVVHDHPRGVLLVRHGAVRGSVHVLRIRYATEPRPARPLFDQRNATGAFRTPSDDVFTNDEPVGASTWYAVNDQPSDKARYDFRLRVPAPRVGVANGQLVSRKRVGDAVVTRYHLDRPAASYLVTAEFGRYRMTRLRPLHGVPLTLWTPPNRPGLLHASRFLRKALVFDERHLGRYPFASLSVVVVDGYASGMENQTLVTLGGLRGVVSPENLVHEVAHQWYGDTVTPRDWRDVWMNEGMATYLQDAWDARHYHLGLKKLLRWTRVTEERQARRDYGPPADYDPTIFAASNVYFGPELMWQELREKVGARAFWSMVRAWPGVHRYHNAGRTEYLRWIEHRLHRDLGGFFHAWLLGRTSPKFH